MKKICVFATCIFCACIPARAQRLAWSDIPANYALQPFSSPVYQPYGQHRHMCTVFKMGAIGCAVSGVALIYGVGLACTSQSPSNSNLALGLIACSLVADPVFAGMMLGGYLHDRKMARKGLSIIAPKANQIGIAYDF